ncbi:hypothetical protein GA0070622_1204 [Micromonospora sediminicola]|uniref:Uncharacterized protein n=1 Tax=Micromonospora sediminicola TaxID=946078 RepID=A0A1A9B5C7_9ACTN|nr:hypothetical protein [Micromonospora sediminicola]SBT64234.1 hypothetical protein GA0070622_1204 [Micromonospora sediminicola]
MAGMGPPPKPAGQRRRRNATVATTRLPAEGRGGRRAPNWPLVPDVVMAARRDLLAAAVADLEEDLAELEGTRKEASVRRRLETTQEKLAIIKAQMKAQRALEADLWRDLWRLPQAVAWERLRWTRDVAQYVRHKVLAELGDLAAAKEARQWSDRLGLSPMAMLRLRWEVTVDETAAKRAERDRDRSEAETPPATAQPAADPLAALRAV